MPSSLNGTGVTFNDGSTLQSGAIPAANLGSGTADVNTFLRGNRTYADFVTSTATALNATGSAPIYAARAWVNFNGTGTVAIRASGNVSSITDNGVGRYRVNFVTPLPDVNYSVSPGGSNNGAGPTLVYPADQAALTTTYVDVRARDRSGADNDPDSCHISIFR